MQEVKSTPSCSEDFIGLQPFFRMPSNCRDTTLRKSPRFLLEAKILVGISHFIHPLEKLLLVLSFFQLHTLLEGFEPLRGSLIKGFEDEWGALAEVRLG